MKPGLLDFVALFIALVLKAAVVYLFYRFIV
jgi:hypothetical protein